MSDDDGAGDDVFKFVVKSKMKPGDIIRARTPAGSIIELTLPPSASSGDIIQFAVPSDGLEEESEVQEQEEPAVQARVKGSEKINVKDVDGFGVTNALPKLTYVFTIPKDAKEGQQIIVGLPDDERATIQVPSGAKPGHELTFRATAPRKDPKIHKILNRGFMKKRAPKSKVSLAFAKPWQMRWFELTPETLLYWEVNTDGIVTPKGSVPVAEIVEVVGKPDDATRIDLKLRDDTMMLISAPSTDERNSWASAITEAISGLALGISRESDGSSMESIKEEEDDESDDPALALTPAEQEEEENVFEEMSERSRTFEVTSEISKIRIATAPEVQAGGKLDTVVEAVKVDAAVYAGRLARARVTNAQRRSDESKRVSADGC